MAYAGADQGSWSYRDTEQWVDDLDLLHPFRTWPRYLQDMMRIRHKNRQQRFKLFVFFWVNGVEPSVAKFLVMNRGQYDRQAWQSMNDLVNQTQTPQGRRYLSSIPMIDLETRQVSRNNERTVYPSYRF